MQESKNLNTDNEKNYFYKTYEYKNKKALKIFPGFTREKGKNSLKVSKYLERDFPELNFMKITKYKVIKYMPLHIKIETVLENINKTFNGNFISYYDYLVGKDDFELTYKTIDLWYKFEYTFLQKNYFHTDFNLNNFMIDPKTKKIVFIDFDDIKKEPHFKKKLLLTQSIRSFDATLKDILLSMTNMKISDKKEILDKFKSVVSHYDIKMRPKDIEHEKRVLNEK